MIKLLILKIFLIISAPLFISASVFDNKSFRSDNADSKKLAIEEMYKKVFGIGKPNYLTLEYIKFYLEPIKKSDAKTSHSFVFNKSVKKINARPTLQGPIKPPLMGPRRFSTENIEDLAFLMPKFPEILLPKFPDIPPPKLGGNPKLDDSAIPQKKASAKLEDAQAKTPSENEKEIAAKKVAAARKIKAAERKKGHSEEKFVDPTQISIGDLYKKLFGVSKPTEVGIELSLRLVIDTIYKDKVTIQTDTTVSFFKISKDRFLYYLRSHLKKSAFEQIKKQVSSLEYIDGKWLLENRFNYSLKASESKLEIETPEDLRGIQIIDLGRDQFIIGGGQQDLDSHFFSAFSNIYYENSQTNFTEVQNENKIALLNIDSHVALGNVFIDSAYLMKDGRSFFDYLEVNSFLNTATYFTRVGLLKDKPIFGFVVSNSFINTYTSKYKNTNELYLEVNEESLLNIYVNGGKQNTREVAPGRYILRNIPVVGGPNEIEVKVFSKKNIREKPKSYNLFDYKSTHLLYPLELQFKVIGGLYDSKSKQTNDIKERVERKNKVLLFEQSLGLFSFGKYGSNLTLSTFYSHSPHLKEIKNDLKTGTPFGILTGSYTQSIFNSFPYDGKKAALKFNFLAEALSKSLRKWEISLSKKNSFFREFNIQLTSISNDSLLGNPPGYYKLINLLEFTEFNLFSTPFVTQQELTIYDDHKYKFKFKVSLSHDISEDLKTNFSLTYDASNQNESDNGFAFLFSMNYQRNAREYPMTGSLDYSSKLNEIRYNNQIILANIDENPMTLGFNPSNVNYKFSLLTNAFKNDLGYASNSEGDVFKFSTSIDNFRTGSEFNYTKQFSGGTTRIFNSRQLKINSTLYMVGSHFAIGRRAEKPSFAIIEKSILLEGTTIVVNKDSVIDSFGPAVIGTLAPLVDNSLILSFDSLPESVDIVNANLNIYSEYGKGYYTMVGEEAPAIVLGKIIDQNDDPVSLKYLEITGSEDKKKHTVFTNRKGKFEFKASKKQHYIVVVLGYNANPFGFSVPDDFAGGILRLKAVKLVRKLH